MAVFLDSGILLRAIHRSDPLHAQVRAGVRGLMSRNMPIFTGLQHLAEFWNVATRPTSARGGLNLPLDEAARRLQRVRRGVRVITETPITPDIWATLVRKHGVKGVQVHDARTVALMMTHSVSELLTLNKQDYLRYHDEGIRVVTPVELLAGMH